MPVAMAYCGDVYAKDKIKLEASIGAIIGIFCLAFSAGNLLAIIMDSAGLFDPLFIAIGLNVLGGGLITYYMVEPDKELFGHHHAKDDDDAVLLKEAPDEESAVEESDAPTELDWNLVNKEGGLAL